MQESLWRENFATNQAEIRLVARGNVFKIFSNDFWMAQWVLSIFVNKRIQTAYVNVGNCFARAALVIELHRIRSGSIEGCSGIHRR